MEEHHHHTGRVRSLQAGGICDYNEVNKCRKTKCNKSNNNISFTYCR
jgi:hypothetical protein